MSYYEEFRDQVYFRNRRKERFDELKETLVQQIRAIAPDVFTFADFGPFKRDIYANESLLVSIKGSNLGLEIIARTPSGCPDRGTDIMSTQLPTHWSIKEATEEVFRVLANYLRSA